MDCLYFYLYNLSLRRILLSVAGAPQSGGLIAAFSVLLIIVMIGILFDIIGVAVTAADKKPFHSMAAQKIPEAADALRLLRNADPPGQQFLQ